MKCSAPYVINSQAHACTRCLACRINRRRLWAHRIKLEACNHAHKSFLTLTYSEENLPRLSSGLGWTLRPEDLRNFLKRLRRHVEPSKLRYFAVGEYGEKTGRPHYHLATFGVSSCSFGRSRYSEIYDTCCEWCELCKKTWGHGHIFNGELNDVTAGYIAGYVVKKMTAADDHRLLQGQYPEFARMSLRPGIGADLMDDVASSLLFNEFDGEDVPGVLRHGMKMQPLGRYLRQRLRERIGRDKSVPASVVEAMKNEMQPLRAFAFENSRALSSVVTEFYSPETTRLELLEEFNKKGKKL